jgi:hypothetical protein
VLLSITDSWVLPARLLTALCLFPSLAPPALLLSPAGFVGEVKAKYTAQMAEVFRETFCWLPLGFVIADKVLVVS